MTKDEVYQCLVVEKKTLQETGDLFGITRERVRQIFRRYFPDMSRDEYGQGAKIMDKLFLEELLEKEKAKQLGRDAWHHANDLSRVMSLKYSRKKQNVKSSKWDWDINFTDIQWNLTCPILGMELDYFTEQRAENSPSFDRIDCTKGYVKGNVQIISWRANRLKNDGTAEEHEKIAAHMRAQTQI